MITPIDPIKREWLVELRKEKGLKTREIAEIFDISFQHFNCKHGREIGFNPHAIAGNFFIANSKHMTEIPRCHRYIFEITAILALQLPSDGHTNRVPGPHFTIIANKGGHYLCKLIMISIVPVVRNFVPDPESNQHSYRHTCRQPQNVDD